MPGGAGYISYCIVVTLLALLALPDGTAALQLPPHLFQTYGIHRLFGRDRTLLERHLDITPPDLLPKLRAPEDPRTEIDERVRAERGEAEAEVRNHLPRLPSLPTLPEIPHIHIDIDIERPNLLPSHGLRHEGLDLVDFSGNFLANIPDSRKTQGRHHIKRPNNILHMSPVLTKLGVMTPETEKVASSPSPLPSEDASLCNLDYSGISNYPGLDSCKGSDPKPEECCATLRSFMDGVANQNPHLFLAITTVPALNTNCRKVFKDWLKTKGVEHNVFHICPPTAILPLTTVTPQNTCPITAMQDFKRRVKLPVLTKKCTNSKEPCTTCSDAILRTAIGVAHTDSPSIIGNCTSVIIFRLAQSEPGPVASDLIYIQRSCRSSLVYTPPPTAEP